MGTVKKFWYYVSTKKLTIANAAFILGLTGLLSNILGLYRERIIAGHFGAGHMTDAFYASFRLPDLIFNLLILGALSSAFIPVFVEKIAKDKEEEANLIAYSFMNFILVCTLIFGVVVFILAPKLVPLLLPGFFNRPSPDNFEMFQTTVNMTRIMILSPILFAISGIIGGILNSRKRFVAYSIAPLVYNIAIILSVLYLTKYFNPPIYAVTIGVIAGALLYVLVQVPSVIVAGFRWRPYIDFKRGQIARLVKLMIPRTLAIGANQINLLVDTIVASFFVGGITVLNFANNIQTAPIVIFGISIATAIFPVLAENKTKKDMTTFMKSFSWSARRILYFMVPSTIIIIVLRAQIVRLIYGTGNFSWDNTYWTTKALLFFAIGLVAQGLIPLLLKAFYAIQDTKTPLYISIVVLVVNAILSVSLPFIAPLQLGVAGIALAFSIAGILNAILLFILLHEKIGALDRDHKIFESAFRLVVASILMGILAHYSLYLFDYFVDTNRVLGLFLQTSGAVLFGGMFYVFLTWAFKCEETNFILEKLKLKSSE
ncbi:MAG: murein biosynthesis integral membrane protein MurJ [Patescibacteria group bacterium]|jgi:putative peptidoglycan lipid II flippase|nr:murein biosynthesis integral membrane protein MurJ [Patescibacteria group bacterium]